MRRSTAPIRKLMSRAPVTIGRDETLATAHALMRQHRVRHLPVLDGKRLVGVVSMGDLHFLETLRDVDIETVRVDEAMTPEPYVVRPGTSLATVARTMMRRKLGSALVAEEGRVVGIFTTVDALRALIR